MVIKTKQTTIAYRCRKCGAGILSAVSIFALKGDMLKLKCDCGGSEITIVHTKDNKIRLSVPCVFCPKPHNYTVSPSVFFGKEVFILSCPYTDLDICFMGETNEVKAALAKSELELIKILEDSGISSFDALHNLNNDEISDSHTLDIVLFVLKELQEEHKIFCNCEDVEEGFGDYSIEVLEDGVLVRCSRCGASKVVPTDSFTVAEPYIHSDNLILE